MDLDIINRLFLELSQVATATTAKELKLEAEVKRWKGNFEAARHHVTILQRPSGEIPSMKKQLAAHIAMLTVTRENIGKIRRSLFMPFDCEWNGWVRGLTAEREILQSL